MFEITNILLQYSGIISIGLIIATGYNLVKNDPGTDHTSVSSYAGATRSQARLGFLALIVFSVPLYVWILFWLIPQYELSAILYQFIAISILCHIILVRFPLIPSNGRKHLGNLLHLGAGGIIAISMLGLLLTLLFSSTINGLVVAKIILLASATFMVTSLLAYVISREKKYFFVFEVIYILLFAICIGVVTVRI